MDCGLAKEERISSKSSISILMKEGKWSSYGLLRCCVRRREGESLNRIMVSVPKKSFKRAVKRNILKRRIRESYRLSKNILPPVGLDILFFYCATDVAPFPEIRDEMQSILTKLAGC